MRLQIFEYQCEPSGHAFSAPDLPLNAYGEFLLRSEGGDEMVYLNAIADPTYKEVDALLQQHPSLAGVSAIERADILRRVYGAVACDPDSSGRAFHIGLRPRCPVCSSTDMKSWNEVQPVEFIDLDIPKATHLLWATLTEDQKAGRVNGAVTRLQ